MGNEMSTARKAVVFTHIGLSSDDAKATRDARGAIALVERVNRQFRRLLMCKNVGLVYVYVDVGTRIVLQHLAEPGFSEKGGALFGLEELEDEDRTRNCLKLAVDLAIRDLVNSTQESFDPRNAPPFQFVGLPHLLSIFHGLNRIDPALMQDLAGNLQVLTYDSPKFVEAVIRLVRQPHPIHGTSPIFRFDEDVEVNEQGVGHLLSAVDRAVAGGLFHCDFFSGGYGRIGGSPQPVNDHAVRCHWLAVEGSTERLIPRGASFLRDIGELGATQVGSNEEPSSAVSEFLAKRTGGRSLNRRNAQVISGAGLYMSFTAIEELPPFMNMSHLTTWVDDHLKRRLHEALGHLTEGSLERVEEARFHQDRHPDGIGDGDRNWAKTTYLERLFRGCLLHALITTSKGEPGPLSRAVHVIKTTMKQPDDATLRDVLVDAATKAAEDVLEVWERADYGNVLLRDWVGLKRPQTAAIVASVVGDAVSYLRLVESWRKYVARIRQLEPRFAYWLFREVDGPRI